ncbi:MAG: RecX family transcriptional regulator [Flavobacteriaceae bacterium]|nr:RecX family transcriptional regulator [Flavobacteriaceae bacterium]
MNSKPTSSVEEVLQKLEYYCSYQERCHVEVQEKLRSFVLSNNEKDTIIVHLIEHNFLNEERFASVFSISKFHQKYWGKIRIKNELKARRISDFLITKAIKEIPSDEYQNTFDTLSEKHWETITERNALKKRKKFCDYLLRKGWESDWVYEKVKELEK